MDKQRKRITVYVTDDQHKEIKSFCAKIGMSMSHFIDVAIRNEIKKRIIDKR